MCESSEAAEWLKSNSDQIQDGGRRPNLKWFNRCNSVTDCPIALKFSTMVYYGSAKPASQPREEVETQERLAAVAGRTALSNNAALIVCALETQTLGLCC